MYCHKCGKEIDDDAVVCVHCGVETKNLNKKENAPINIVNQSSSSSGTPTSMIIRKKHSAVLDIIMIFFTGGIWLIWMLIRDLF